ncbi:MAG: hypothetical protein HYR90_05010 [Candidatus Andersenbacteria bacterium]|nr:hypothetical protein [Candidatus Andersenbacteria bacterium]MBI3250751.1 hypothetical protein [Candidatus Andersenbacteria bacterium]
MRTKILFSLFVTLLTFSGILINSIPVLAQDEEDPCAESPFGCFEAPLPGIFDGKILDYVKDNEGSALTSYVGTVVEFVTATIIIVGLILIVGGGYVYMTAGGSAERVGTAKTMIGSALLGIVLALVAVLILNTLSPQFAEQAKEPCIGEDCPE